MLSMCNLWWQLSDWHTTQAVKPLTNQSFSSYTSRVLINQTISLLALAHLFQKKFYCKGKFYSCTRSITTVFVHFLFFFLQLFLSCFPCFFAIFLKGFFKHLQCANLFALLHAFNNNNIYKLIICHRTALQEDDIHTIFE